MNRRGEIVIQPTWIAANNFHDGLATVKKENGLYGYITPTGEEAFEGNFIWTTKFSLGTALVKKENGLCSYITLTGEKAFEGEFVDGGNLSEKWGMVQKEKGGPYICINKKGEQVLKMEFDRNYICNVKEGMFYAYSKGVSGYVNTQGEWLYLKPRFY